MDDLYKEILVFLKGNPSSSGDISHKVTGGCGTAANYITKVLEELLVMKLIEKQGGVWVLSVLGEKELAISNIKP